MPGHSAPSPHVEINPIVALINSAIPKGLPTEIRQEVWSTLAIAILENDGALPPAATIKRIVSRARGDSHLNAFKHQSLDDYLPEWEKSRNRSRRIDHLSAEGLDELRARSHVITRGGRPGHSSPCPHCHSSNTSAEGWDNYSGGPRSYCHACNRGYIDRRCRRDWRRPSEAYLRARRHPHGLPSRDCPRCGSTRTHAAGFRRNGVARSLCRACQHHFADHTRERRSFEDGFERGVWVRLRKKKRPCDPRWALYANFLADLGRCPRGQTLVRLDESLPFGPTNCQWAPRPAPKTQETRARRSIARHTRASRMLERCALAFLARLRRSGRDHAATAIAAILGEAGLAVAA